MSKYVLDFYGLSRQQIDDCVVVFAGLKEAEFRPVPEGPNADLVFEENLPPADDIGAVILNWGDRRLGVMLSLLDDRLRGYGEFRLVSIIDQIRGHELWSFHLIKRYSKFCRLPSNDQEMEWGFIHGEWDPAREENPSTRKVPWFGGQHGANSISLALRDLGRPHGRPVYGELPGGWWAKPEFGEQLS